MQSLHLVEDLQNKRQNSIVGVGLEVVVISLLPNSQSSYRCFSYSYCHGLKDTEDWNSIPSPRLVVFVVVG